MWIGTTAMWEHLRNSNCPVLNTLKHKAPECTQIVTVLISIGFILNITWRDRVHKSKWVQAIKLKGFYTVTQITAVLLLRHASIIKVYQSHVDQLQHVIQLNSLKTSLVKKIPRLRSQDKKAPKFSHLINITGHAFNTAPHRKISRLRSNKCHDEIIFSPV
jgi:hypothetical protein